MLRPSTELPIQSTPDLPRGDDAETLHEAARQSIRTRIRRATQPLIIEPPLPDQGGQSLTADDIVAEGTPEVAPIPAAPIELPAPYEPGARNDEDLHEGARKRIRKITQPIEVPLPATTSARYVAAEPEAGPERKPRRIVRGALFFAGMLLIAGILNYRTFEAAFNYRDLSEKEIRALAPELGGGYIVNNQGGAQFVGYLLRDNTQTSAERASVLAGQLLDRLSDKGVRKVLLLDRDNIPVAVKARSQ